MLLGLLVGEKDVLGAHLPRRDLLEHRRAAGDRGLVGEGERLAVHQPGELRVPGRHSHLGPRPVEPAVVRRDELLLGVQRVDRGIQISQIVVIYPASLLLTVLDKLNDLADHVTDPEETPDASQVQIAPPKRNLRDLSPDQHPERVDRQHEPRLLVRNVRKDNKVEEDGVGEVWALVFAPSLVDVVETSQSESPVQDPEALGD